MCLYSESQISFLDNTNTLPDDYNYNSNTNNWSILIGDKINQQPDRHDNSLLDKINKKLEFLETVERSTIYTKLERKNDSFLDLLERMKTLNLE